MYKLKFYYLYFLDVKTGFIWIKSEKISNFDYFTWTNGMKIGNCMELGFIGEPPNLIPMITNNPCNLRKPFVCEHSSNLLLNYYFFDYINFLKKFI